MVNQYGTRTVSDSLNCLAYAHLLNDDYDDDNGEEVQCMMDSCNSECSLNNVDVKETFNIISCNTITFNDEGNIKSSANLLEGTNEIVDRRGNDNISEQSTHNSVTKSRRRCVYHSTMNSQKRCCNYSSVSQLSTIQEGITFEEFIDTRKHNSDIGSLLDLESEDDIANDCSECNSSRK